MQKKISKLYFITLLLLSFCLIVGLELTTSDSFAAPLETTVKDFKELKKALEDKTTTKVVLANDILVTGYAYPVLEKRQLVIEGNNHQLLSDRGYNIVPKGEGTILLSNIVVGSSGNPVGKYLFDSGSDKIDYQLTDVSTTKDNVIGMIKTTGEVKVLNSSPDIKSEWKLTFPYANDYVEYSLISSGKFLLLNSKLSVDTLAGTFFYSNGINDVSFEVNNSTLYNTSMGYVSNIYVNGLRTKMKFLNNSDVTIENKVSSAKGIDSSGMIWGVASSAIDTGMTFTIESSKAKFYSNAMSALVFEGHGSSFYLNNKSNLSIETNEVKSGTSGKYPAIRYSNYGGAKFKVDNQSEMSILKNGGYSAGIRMVDPNNEVYVSGKSIFKVHNKGVPKTSKYDELYDQAIEYGVGSINNSFIIEEESIVDLKADNGSALTSRGDAKILMDPGTSFSAVANTSYATFRADTLTFDLNKPKYFDFSNQKEKAAIMNNADSKSTMALNHSLLSIWKKDKSINGSPYKTFDELDIRLSGNNLGKIDSSSDPKFNKDVYTNMTDLGRINANNSQPRVDHILQPTNADKFVYIHASVPEMYETLRSAFEDEMTIEGNIILPNGQKHPFKEKTQGSIDIYGEANQTGYVKVAAPNNELLPVGSKVIVDRAYRGTSERPIEAETITDPVTTINIIPPKPAEITDEIIQASSKKISGTGKSGSNVYLMHNGKRQESKAVVNSDGKFEIALPKGIKKGDTIQVLLNDGAKQVNIKNPPSTHGSDGNTNPIEDLKYHDTTFPKGSKIIVSGGLSFSSVPETIDFGGNKISNKSVSLRPQKMSENLVVFDDRDAGVKDTWRILLKQTSDIFSAKDDTKKLSKAKWFYTMKNGKNAEISAENSVIEDSSNFKSDTSVNITNAWNGNRGLNLEVPVENQLLGDYTGKLNWTLENVPGN